MKKLLLAACLTMGLVSCAHRSADPELGKIYNDAARQSHVDRNPIIVIPGVLGSGLVDDETGEIVWGTFGSGAISLRSDGGMRSLALPLSEKGWPKDSVRTNGTLGKVNIAWGFNFRLEAYSKMLEAFGIGGYLDSNQGGFDGINYGGEHFTCFQFPYDWRRSNAENAALLGKFIEEKRRYVAKERKRLYGSTKPVKFDIVAHSMGGLVARYHMMYGKAPLSNGGNMPVTWAGARNVDKLILVGTPNLGSAYAFKDLKDGLKLSILLPRIQAAVIGSMPSTYEILPPEFLDSLIDKDSKPIPYYDIGEWESRSWGLLNPGQDRVLEALLPEVADPQERRKVARGHLQKMLNNAKAFHRAMGARSSPPKGLKMYAYVGDAEGTGSRVQVVGSGEMEVIDFVPGDGIVPRSSALADLRRKGEGAQRLKSTIPWAGVNFVFSSHQKMTSDASFVDNVLYLLLESP